MKNSELTLHKENTPVVSERDRAAMITPAVDIFENDDALTLVADLPGVSKEHLELGIDRQVLTIEGRFDRAEEGALYREFCGCGFYRRFHLPDNLDLNQTNAELKDGVLTLRLPKAASAKPRRIEITAR
ncbi:Hsp20/alpha crystallin family protein [Trichloromonas sp.]|uniref:Hsp20/alpha crystallin family protein n=1 Tax=Trichloromonas sp. TaxID=3069249 RepID=UPI002A472283|nr:Hsp20/alpha crystallin family protein [Trichloromonas sp.]